MSSQQTNERASSMTLVERDTTPDLSGLSLDELAEYIAAECAEVNSHAQAAIGELSAAVIHGIRAGEALLEAKARHTGNSDWTAWLDAKSPMGRWQAHKFMRWAFYKDEIAAMDDITVTAHNVSQLLAGLPMIPRITDRRSLPEDTRDEIKDLAAQGVSRREIARRTNVHTETVRRLTDPAAAEKLHAKQRRYQQRRTDARKALERQERDRAAKKVGGRVDKAYSLIRQACAEIDGAMAELESGRGDLRLALSAAHKAEDHISAAIRKAS